MNPFYFRVQPEWIAVNGFNLQESLLVDVYNLILFSVKALRHLQKNYSS